MNRVTVIIPTLNEENYIGTILADLSHQSKKPDEVIIVDGGSEDQTRAIVEQAGVKCIQSEKGVGRQRTRGGKEASGDVLVFLDADTHLDTTFLERLITKMQAKQYDIVCPWYVPHQSTIAITGTYYMINIFMHAFQKISPSGAGGCIAVNREIFDAVGGFNQDYKFDDIVFIRAAAKKGKFGMVSDKVHVSDRRFKKYGTARMLLTYIGLSFFFMFGLFKLSNAIPYEFGTFKEKP